MEGPAHEELADRKDDQAPESQLVPDGPSREKSDSQTRDDGVLDGLGASQFDLGRERALRQAGGSKAPLDDGASARPSFAPQHREIREVLRRAYVRAQADAAARNDLIFDERFQAHVGEAPMTFHQAERRRAGANPLQDLLCVPDREADRGARAGLREGGDQRRKDMVCDGGACRDLKRPVRLTGRDELCRRAVDQLEDAAGRVVQLSPLRRERDSARGPQEKRDAQLGLQAPDLSRDRRLGPMQDPRRRQDASRVGDRQERGEESRIEGDVVGPDGIAAVRRFVISNTDIISHNIATYSDICGL